MVDISIVDGGYKLTYNWGAPSCIGKQAKMGDSMGCQWDIPWAKLQKNVENYGKANEKTVSDLHSWSLFHIYVNIYRRAMGM